MRFVFAAMQQVAHWWVGPQNVTFLEEANVISAGGCFDLPDTIDLNRIGIHTIAIFGIVNVVVPFQFFDLKLSHTFPLGYQDHFYGCCSTN
jgi:hypothetical protein